jgi:hypothetical protein
MQLAAGPVGRSGDAVHQERVADGSAGAAGGTQNRGAAAERAGAGIAAESAGGEIASPIVRGIAPCGRGSEMAKGGD